MSNETDGAALLEKHKPILVLFPQEPGKRSRPGVWRPGPPGWGDYHPCNVEFFLERAHLRKIPPGFDLFSLFRSWNPLPRTGVDAIKAGLASDSADGRGGWELDVAEVPSQSEELAWCTYRSLLQEKEEKDRPYRCVVYGRHKAGPPASLQYWYLYIYNDFRNNQEADWEMVTIELTPDNKPAQVGYSSHAGGSRRDWSDVETQGDRPLVHVALGSHAGYFEYRLHGYTPLNLIYRWNLPAPLTWVLSALRLPLFVLSRLPGIRRWRDLPPKDPGPGGAQDSNDTGVRVSPDLCVLPDDIDQPADSPWWWLRYRGKWGSTRPRLAGTVGIGSPWGDGGQDPRWKDPVAWLRGCKKDKPQKAGTG